MRTNVKVNIVMLLVTLTTSMIATELSAHSIANKPIKGNCISIEAFKIDWAGDARNVSFSTSTWFVTGQYQANQTMRVVGEIPFSRFSTGNRPFSSALSESVIGNPYIGIAYNSTNSGFVSEVGIRLPITSSDNALASMGGMLADFDRAESFLPEILSIRTRLGSEYVSPTGDIQARFLAGPTVWIPSNGGFREPEILGDMVASLWYQTGTYGIGADFSGRYHVTEQGPSFGERSQFQIGLGANATLGNIRPGLHVQVPLNNDGLMKNGFGTEVSAVYSFNISYMIR